MGVRHDGIRERTILFLSANPIETDRISIDEEVREIQGSLERSRLRDCFAFETRWATRAQELLPLLRTLQPAVVHFSGHGGASVPTPPSSGAVRDVVVSEASSSTKFGIYLVGPDRHAHWVSGEALARALRATTSVQLVVLNACYSDALADALLSHVPCVVGMATAIKDDAARSFAAAFYRAIGDGTSVAAAFREGVNAINFEGLPDTDCPRLRSGAGVDPDQIVIAPADSDARTDGDGRSIDELPPPPRIWQRLGAAISTAFSDGHGAYLLAMLAFGAAATFLCRTLQAEREYHEALTTLVTEDQEPYRAETHQVLAAGLLRKGPWYLCNDKELLSATAGAMRQFTRDLEAALNDPASLTDTLHECPYKPRRRKCPQFDEGFPAPLTDSANDSTLMVPGSVASMVKQDSTRRTVLIASRSIAKHGLRGREFPQGTIENEYFVDLSGSLRVIPPWIDNRLPAHRTFAGAGYMYSTLSRRDRCPGSLATVTRPYLDVIGMGMVKTLCYRVDPKPQVAGILCFDVAPPKDVVHRFLEVATRLFDLHVVKIKDGDRNTYAVEDAPKSLTSLSDSEVRELATEWERRPTTELAAGESAVRILGDYFGTPIKYYPKSDEDPEPWTEVVFGRIRRSPTRNLSSAVMMLLFAGIGSAAIVGGVRKKAKRLDVALIRGLQVGVLKLDDRDFIVGANDRAQEIFDVELPAFDAPKRRLARPLSSLILGHVIVLDGAGRLRSPVKVKDYGEIKKERDAGSSSSYYALVKRSNLLIRISGSTYMTPELEVHTFGTVDTFIDEAHRTKVLAAFERARRGRRAAGKQGA